MVTCAKTQNISNEYKNAALSNKKVDAEVGATKIVIDSFFDFWFHA